MPHLSVACLLDISMFITARQIHDGHKWLPDGTVIEVADDGTVVSLQSGSVEGAVFYEGILVPAFINAHCHLELSHMKGVGGERTGLIPFLKNIPLNRNNYTDEQKRAARYNGYKELVRNGVIAVGDISNTTDPLDIRALDELHYYSFIEILGFTQENAQRIYEHSIDKYNEFAAQPKGDKILQQAIVPHAPYSVSAALFRLIDGHSASSVISVHNQECDDENMYYISKKGGVSGLLNTLGIDDTYFQPSGRSSLQTYLEWMTPGHTFLLVHNTCATSDDIRFAHSRMPSVYWCLCPNANLYIEGRLPDVNMLIVEKANICIGTDSLASNHQLCVLSELVTLKQNFPHLDWETLFTWGTANGAAALHMLDIIGTIEPGKKPGIVQVTGIDGAGKPAAKRII